ncbi:RNA polymerase II C-terminal domain phosphatase-like 4 isoform X2 [Lotus japonicus]|uniref:RNA polymerase II C-terminal domain phosphatase-like 4 isoform X2 n=1 Tax=Lotus japonicus TaxID=34305 RepID=UPI002588F825|nr:RNA polymerase II C-terminal domain phosphatase-like 4 isoform X2 [Lotus japonicus]
MREGKNRLHLLMPSHQSILTQNTDARSANLSSDNEAENIDESESGRTKRRKVETTEAIEESTLRQNSEVSVENVCAHPGSFGSLCIRCGQKLDEEYGVSFGYIHKGLRLHDEEISRLRNKDMKNLLCQKKLYLVLDLDNTLLNSTRLGSLSSEELHLLTQTDSQEDISNGSLFKLECVERMTKLRPFVRTFLKEASKMFEMYIYTMASRRYALEVVKLLDPQGEYFNDKVISRYDGTQKHQKGLDVVLGPESAILILDDTHRVWTKHQDNLIMIKRYHYFASDLKHFGFSCKSLAEMKVDEQETTGVLARMLNVLKQVHFTFFDKLEEDYVDRDVRKVVSSLRSEVLSGCVIVFFRTKPAPLPFLQEIAMQMGATCMEKLDPSVTHVVSTKARTEKFQWAEKENKFLVHPQWIYDAYCFWQKPPETNYICKNIDRERKKTGPDTTTEGGATTITASDSAAQPRELRQEGLQTATAVMDSL